MKVASSMEKIKQFDVLSPSLKLSGRFFIEASAGTGKTFSIEHLVIRALIEEKIPFEKFLIVTFTNAAATDLKKRIFKTLLSIQSALSNPSLKEALPPYLKEETEKETVLLRIQEAIEKSSQAAICTIHAFCYRFLTEEGFHLKLPIELHANDSLIEVIKDFFRDLNSKEIPSIWMKEFLKGYRSLDEAIRYGLLPYLALSVLPEEKISFETLFFQLKEFQIEKEFFQEIETVFPLLKGMYSQKEKRFKYAVEWDLFCSFFLKKSVEIQDFESVLKSWVVLEKISPEELLKKHQEDPSCVQRVLAIKERIQPIVELMKKACDPSFILLQIIDWIQQKVTPYLEKNPLMDPDFLLKKMAVLVSQKEVALQLQTRYAAIFIDEFQDTDALQWKIFETAFFEKKTTHLFVCVGDPKQSIYGFRQADIEIYLAAKKRFLLEEQFVLNGNYRSEPKLIEALNRCFASTEKVNFFAFDESKYTIDYYPLMAKQTSDFGLIDDKKPLHFPFFKGSQYQEIESAFLFPYLIQEYRSLIKKGIEPCQIAFLVKDHYQGLRIKKAFEKVGVGLTLIKTQRLDETDSFWLMAFLFEWFLDLQNFSKLKKIALHPDLRENETVGSDSFILRLQAFQKKMMGAIPQPIQSKNWPLFLANCVEFFQLKKKLSESGDSSCFDHWIQMEETVSFHILKSNTVFDLKRQLNEWKKNHLLDGETLKKRVIQADHSPLLMTIHASKGLEFDIVFVLGLYLSSFVKPDLYQVKRGNEKFWSTTQACQAGLQDPLIEMEKMRQFYVALTRAKKRVYLPILYEQKPSRSAPFSLSIQSLYLKRSIWQTSQLSVLYEKALSEEELLDFFSRQTIGSFEPIETIEPVKVDETEHLDSPQVLNKKVLFPPPEKHQKWVSFSDLADKNNLSPSLKAEDGLQGPLFGQFFHLIMEKLIEERWFDRVHDPRFQSWLQKKLTLTPYVEFQQKFYEWIEAIVHFPLNEEGLTIASLPYQCLIAESQFKMALGLDCYLKGFIDLIVHYDGKTYLIDFKTNYLGDSSSDYASDALFEAINKQDYALQAACYLQAASRYFKKIRSDQEIVNTIEMVFMFIRGLPFHQGIYRLKETEELKNRLEYAQLRSQR